MNIDSWSFFLDKWGSVIIILDVEIVFRKACQVHISASASLSDVMMLPKESTTAGFVAV